MHYVTNIPQATKIIPADATIILTGNNGTKEVTFTTFMEKYAAGTNWQYFAEELAKNGKTTKLDWYCGYNTATLSK